MCEEGNRDSNILFNLSEMIQINKFINAMMGANRNKAYDSITKHADKHMLKKAMNIGRLRLYKYFLFITYVMHGFKIFDRDFAKGVLYFYIKKSVNE